MTSFQEVKVPNTSYSKLVSEDGSVAVLLASDRYPWTSSVFDINKEQEKRIKEQMLFDSRIALYVLSDEYKTLFNLRKFQRECEFAKAEKIYEVLMKTIFPDIDLNCNLYFSFGSFSELKVVFVPKNKAFRIDEYDGCESIVLYNPLKYYHA
jgi:hypothetical protein